MDITYTAKRNIITSHSASSSYTIVIGCSVIQPLYEPLNVFQHRSLDGEFTTRYFKQDKKWQIVTVPFGDTPDTEDHHDEFLEFISSVEGGELFTIDPYENLATDLNVRLDIRKGYQFNRVNPVRGTSLPTWTLSFTAIEV